VPVTTSVDIFMEDASPTFRPTWPQALGRGLYLGSLVSVAGITVALLVTVALLAWTEGAAPPAWLWALLAFGPPVTGMLIGALFGRLRGVQICPGGIRTVSAWSTSETARWNQVVDLRAERRGGRTVVSLYLESGRSLQLQAPYSGELLGADPRFEGKMFALSSVWRSHRFGGLPG
jgi:hypothetical protein